MQFTPFFLTMSTFENKSWIMQCPEVQTLHEKCSHNVSSFRLFYHHPQWLHNYSSSHSPNTVYYLKKIPKKRDLLQINFVLKTTIYESQFLRLMVHQVSHKFFASCRGWSKLNTNFRLFPMILRKARRYLTCASIQRARARVRAHIAAAA